jgi:hypothetical protein
MPIYVFSIMRVSVMLVNFCKVKFHGFAKVAFEVEVRICRLFIGPEAPREWGTKKPLSCSVENIDKLFKMGQRSLVQRNSAVEIESSGFVIRLSFPPSIAL